MARTRAYYEAQGFEAAYRYAHHQNAPFQPLAKPLAELTLGLVSTASTYPRKPLEPRKVDRVEITRTLALYADDLSWDKAATHLDDRNSYCPIDSLTELVQQGVLGGLGRHLHCIPTEYSHTATLEHDAPQICAQLKADGVDAALLVPL